MSKLDERQDVWCLTVPDTGCFSLANGAVVHNSHGADAFGLMCVSYEEQSTQRKKADQRSHNFAGGWMQ